MALVNRKDVTSIIFCSVLLQKDQLLCMLHKFEDSVIAEPLEV